MSLPKVSIKIKNGPPQWPSTKLPQKNLVEVHARQEKVKQLEQKIKCSFQASQSHKVVKKQVQTDYTSLHRGPSRPLFVTSEADLLSAPFDYESEIKARVSRAHDTHELEERIEEIDKKVEHLRFKRQLKSHFQHHNSSDTADFRAEAMVVDDRVQDWRKDRAGREARLRQRREKELLAAAKKEQEERQKAENQKILQKRIRVANCESKLHEMNQQRLERDQMNRYQNKVVVDLLRHPRTYYFYQASEEALQKVRSKLMGKLDSHKVKLEEQQSRLLEFDRNIL